MALIVTSCTMGKQPKQLLDKGPDYLRTKTNRQLFAHHRKSAVELLAASRPQFVKSTQALNKSCSFDNSIQGSSFGKSGTKSKSEYSLCQDIPDGLEDKREIDQLDSGIVRVNIQSTTRSETHCCINGSQGRKINKSHRNYVDPDSSCFKQLHSLVPTRYGNKLKEANKTNINQETVQDTEQDTMSEEEKMMVDNVMTLSTDMSSTQDVDMEYKSGFVQRSHSDLSCQHSRSSPVLMDRNSARYSRASADLEKFFNGMGIERNILDPMLRRQDNTTQKDGDIFESISSLDSPDTRSVCSGVSKLSEKTYSSTDCLERTLQSTSVVERNARIIKWLCNIKKAKQPLTSD
ncbi:hypothetical protein LOTGIDRAFT_234592 [Lottia gigantea]|uniref:Centrosome-associated FAM110 C-terminal domain-containing protein n=1 Tax=Lottia gigantea TaxID=225164 RepID=V4A004_LOTGI|nr:hypothetical protein LOTGIDRAFT_234592 [Lottia gigantea]ESO88255.1 hypothetical protein LOTGIDRAFT_234592 [Lottia gigantea]